MDERAAIPVTLPRENPTQSYWQDPPDEIADLRTTASRPESADVVIIGSGITGAAVAWNRLSLDNAPGIVMLEARQACSGATGRNGPSPKCFTEEKSHLTDNIGVIQVATRKRRPTGPSSTMLKPWAQRPL